MLDHFPYGSRDHPCGKRASKLIGEEGEPRPVHGSAHHVLDETPVTRRRCSGRQGHPNHRMGRILQHHLFCFGFRLPVDVERIDLIAFDISALRSVKHLIARKEHKRNVMRQFCKTLCRLDIDLPCENGILLALAGVTQRGAVNNRLRLEPTPERLDLPLVQ